MESPALECKRGEEGTQEPRLLDRLRAAMLHRGYGLAAPGCHAFAGPVR